MTYYVGQRASISTEVRDEAGALTAATVACTVTAPDGTVSTPTVGSTVTGVYDAAVTLDQAGDWLIVWTVTGAVVATTVDQLHVILATLRVVSLAEVKEHANITGTAHDRELLDFIGTAQQMIEGLVGVTVPRTITDERHTIRAGALWLHHTPVLSVTSVTEYTGATGTALAADGYRLDLDAGTVTRLTSGTDTRYSGTHVLVTYRAGRQPIPEGIRWAAKELTVHLWRRSQTLRGGRGRSDADASPVGIGYGMPNAVADALSPYLLAPAVA